MATEFKLINFSDPYTFEAEDYETAALVVLCLSTAYGAESRDGKISVPILHFADGVEWFKKEFDKDPKAALAEKREKVAEALMSMAFGSFRDRDVIKTTLECIDDESNRKKFMDTWNDRRTSLNDIGTQAHELGESMKSCTQ